MSDLSDFLHTFDYKFETIKQTMFENLHTEVSLITDMKEKEYFTGGKRLRALVAVLACNHYHIDSDISNKIAVGIEFIHTASLLHDDVVDQAKIRRHLPAAACVYGSTAAILAGDFLYSRASQIFADIGNIQLLKNVATATNKLTEGELFQLLNRDKQTISQDDYFTIIEYKTANLFKTAAAAASAIAEVNDKAMAEYGHYLGMVFQIIDDCLDYQGTTQNTGKKIGIDFSENKMTLPIIIMLSRLDGANKAHILEQWQGNSVDSFEEIMQQIYSTDAMNAVYEIAKKITKKAIDALAPLQNSPDKDALITLAELSLKRDR